METSAENAEEIPQWLPGLSWPLEISKGFFKKKIIKELNEKSFAAISEDILKVVEFGDISKETNLVEIQGIWKNLWWHFWINV